MVEATKADALNPNWACPNCAWPEAELIEVDTLDVPSGQNAGDPASSGSPDREQLRR